MYLYSKSDTKKFIKKNNFIDRNNYAVKNEKELGLVKNIGKKEMFLYVAHLNVCTELLHLQKDNIEICFFCHLH